MKLAMIGRLERCFLLAYRIPSDRVAHLVPQGLDLVTHGQWAFWNIVLSRIEAMRPAGFPPFSGFTYHHAAYRLYVKGRTLEGAKQGLYFVRSDADSPLLALAGNRLTDFRFHNAKIRMEPSRDSCRVHIESRSGEGDASVTLARGFDHPDSCFDNTVEAESILKYQPLALSTSGGRLRMAVVRRDESKWAEKPITVKNARWAFFEKLGHTDAALERATEIEPIDYRWELGNSLPLA